MSVVREMLWATFGTYKFEAQYLTTVRDVFAASPFGLENMEQPELGSMWSYVFKPKVWCFRYILRMPKNVSR